MKKGDWVIIITILIIVITSFTWLTIRGTKNISKLVVVKKDQEILLTIKLNESYEAVHLIDEDGEVNEVHFKDGEVWIDNANCQNQVCVRERPISNLGSVIVCLPHKLIIEIEGKNQNLDIISE